jgi:hypothetical protein
LGPRFRFTAPNLPIVWPAPYGTTAVRAFLRLDSSQNKTLHGMPAGAARPTRRVRANHRHRARQRGLSRCCLEGMARGRRHHDRAGISDGQERRRGGRAPICAVRCQYVKIYAERVGLDPALSAGHSMRAGFQTSAAKRGALTFKMMDQSRHRSVETLRDMSAVRKSSRTTRAPACCKGGKR